MEKVLSNGKNNAECETKTVEKASENGGWIAEIKVVEKGKTKLSLVTVESMSRLIQRLNG